MTPIPGKPAFGSIEYSKFGDIIVDDFVVTVNKAEDFYEWRCDKCENWGSSCALYNPDPSQLELFEIPFEQTDDYKFAYFMAQKHYAWYHPGAFRRTTDMPIEELQPELPQQWLNPWRKTKYERFCEYFGVETYHGKHRLEDHTDMPAAREVEQIFLWWHRACVSEYKDFESGTWQNKAWGWSQLNLARGYYPYKRKKHRK